MNEFEIRWCVERSLEEIEKRSEIMTKFNSFQPLTNEEMYKMIYSLRQSDSYIRLLKSDLDQPQVENKKKFKFFRRK